MAMHSTASLLPRNTAQVEEGGEVGMYKLYLIQVG